MPSHPLSPHLAILLGLSVGLALPLGAQTKPDEPAATAPAMTGPEGLTGDPARDAIVMAARERYLAGDHEAALAVIRPEAEAGHPRAMNVLADAYDSGRGVEQDVRMALIWWERAAEAGDPRAPLNIALVHLDGLDGAAPDHALARDWLERSVARGYGPAMARLGRMLEHGEGGPVDLPGALDLYRRGQEAGSDWAFEYEAHLHRTGTGVPENLARARELFAAAAGMGLAQSMNNLAVMLRDGMGGPADPDGAEAQFRAASELGYALADLNLAEFLAFERDPPQLEAALDSCEQGRARDPDLWASQQPICATIAKLARDG